MLPSGIQPFIIKISNVSTITAYPVIILDAYNTLAYVNPNLFVYKIIIVSATPPNNQFYFSYRDANGVLRFTGALSVGDVFSYVGNNYPTLIPPLPTIPYIYTLVPPTPVTSQNFYQNNSNIGITMNPNMNYTYAQFLDATMTNPFEIEQIFFSSDNPSQIADDKPITFFAKDVNGNKSEKNFKPFVNPFQASSEGVIINNKQIIDGFTGFQIDSLLPSTNVELYLYPIKRAEQKLSKNKKFLEFANNELKVKKNNLDKFNTYIQNSKKRLGLD